MKRAVLYLRISTLDQTTANQERELRDVASRMSRLSTRFGESTLRRAFHPATGELYAGVQERDGLGDELPPDYLTRVERGAFYGWPYAYIGPNPQPGFAHRAPEN